MKKLNVKDIAEWAHSLSAGEEILLSGTIYTARDAAHKLIKKAIDENQPLPFELKNSVIYYAGPTPSKPGMPIGSCGPTTSARVDVFAPQLLDMGLKGMIGKGGRSKDVCDAIIRNKAVYLCAIGGAGALAAKCVTSLEVIAYDFLGCESVKKLEVENFPLYTAIDCMGGSLFAR